MDVVFYNSAGSFHDPTIKKLINTFIRLYGDCHNITLTKGSFDSNDALETSKLIKKADRVFIWNGSDVGCFWIKELCKSFSVPYCIFERGLFPQSDSNFIIDKEGICCRSESIQEKYIKGKNISHEIEAIKNHYKQKNIKRLKPENKYVFVFQLEFDSTVYHYSSFKDNEEMVDLYIKNNNINKDDVIICPHPRNKNITSKYKISKNRTIEECQDAKLAVGISSTVMYEIMGMGCPVDVLGGNDKLIHPINRDWSDINLIIPCILQNQFDVDDDINLIKEKIEKNLS